MARETQAPGETPRRRCELCHAERDSVRWRHFMNDFRTVEQVRVHLLEDGVKTENGDLGSKLEQWRTMQMLWAGYADEETGVPLTPYAARLVAMRKQHAKIEASRRARGEPDLRQYEGRPAEALAAIAAYTRRRQGNTPLTKYLEDVADRWKTRTPQPGRLVAVQGLLGAMFHSDSREDET